MPIIVKTKIDKLPEIILLVINYLRTRKNFTITSIDVNGYLFYKYRGTLFVRKGISNTFFAKEIHLLKNYLEYIINYLSNENQMAWTNTVMVLEITVDLKTPDSRNIGVMLDVSNDDVDNYGQIIIRPLVEDENEETKEISSEHDESLYPQTIRQIDDMIIEEDIKMIAPIDVYKIFTMKEVNELLKQLKKRGAQVKVSDETEIE